MRQFEAAEGEDQHQLDAWVDKDTPFPKLEPVAFSTCQPITMAPDGMGEEVTDDAIQLIAHTSQSGGIILDLNDPLLVDMLIHNLTLIAHDIWPTMFSCPETDELGV